MRKADREIKNFEEIADVLRRADTLRLGLHDEPFPYVVPVSFGYEAADGEIALYFHGAKDGYKHDLIKRSDAVCVETDIFHRYAELPNSVTAEYESFIGRGHAKLVTGADAARGIALLLEHCGYADYPYAKSALDFTAVYRVTLESFSAKRRFV